jgi:hypothetical protein
MHAKHLIGKIAIRTKPADLKNGNHDYSYCNGSGVKILDASDTNVVIEGHGGKPWVLDERFANDWKPLYGISEGVH